MPKAKKGVVEQREDFILGCSVIDRAREKYCGGTFNVLAIDPSISSTGWAINGLTLQFGAIQPKSHGFSRLIWIEKVLRKIFNQKVYAPFVGIEGYAYNSKWGREAAGELGGVIRRLLYFQRRPILIVSPLSVKAWIKAKSKSQIMLEIRDQFGVKIDQEDAADAFVIADIISKTLHMADAVVQEMITDPDVLRKWMKDTKYKSRRELKGLTRNKEKTLFNLISNHGRECEFFSIKPL